MQIKTSFHDEKMSTRTRFEREAKDNSEMAYGHCCGGLSLHQAKTLSLRAIEGKEPENEVVFAAMSWALGTEEIKYSIFSNNVVSFQRTT